MNRIGSEFQSTIGNYIIVSSDCSDFIKFCLPLPFLFKLAVILEINLSILISWAFNKLRCARALL